jgi:hypothetical protein
MNDQTTYGANAPPPPVPLTPAEIKAWLDYEMASLLELRGERLTALQAIAASFPRIDDDETLGEIAENVRMAKALIRTAEARRVEQKRPFREGGAAVDTWFKRFTASFDAPFNALQQAMNEYGERKLAAAKREAEAEFAAAKQRAEEAAARAAAALAEAPQKADQQLAEAVEADEAAARAREAAQARPADHTRVYGTFGAVTSMRTRWRYEVTDFNAIPRQYLMLNHDAIKFAAKDRDAQGRPTAEISGITWVPEHSMGVR